MHLSKFIIFSNKQHERNEKRNRKIVVVLTQQKTDLWESSQNHQRKEKQLQKQIQGYSHLVAAEVAETGHPRNPFLNTNKTRKKDQQNQQLKKQNILNKNKSKKNTIPEESINVCFCGLTSMNMDLM
jgi:uncharacterized phage-associated protein